MKRRSRLASLLRRLRAASHFARRNMSWREAWDTAARVSTETALRARLCFAALRFTVCPRVRFFPTLRSTLSREKKMMKPVAVLLLGMSMSSAALANGGAGSFYLALDSALARFNDACSGVEATSPIVCRNTDSTVRFAGGYQFTPLWGMEVSFANMGQSSLTGTVGGTSGTAHLQATATQISATATYEVNAAFAVLGKLGIVNSYLKKSVAPAGFLGGDASASRTTLGFGVGGQITFTAHTGLRFLYEDLGSFGSAATGTPKLQLFSTGFVFRF